MSAERLQAAIGSAHKRAFDFDAMSRLLTDGDGNVPMADSRRRRIRDLLSTLRTQRFFPPATESDNGSASPSPIRSCSTTARSAQGLSRTAAEDDRARQGDGDG